MNNGEDEISYKWPLHWFVWRDEHRAIERYLNDNDERDYDLEALDPRGRTPLHLAVSLMKVKCVDVLLRHNANPLALNRHKWSVLDEAVSTGDPEMIGLVLRCRDQKQHEVTTRRIPLMLERLETASDFYIEMKWEFSSWIPFISRMCPSDTCRIWKKGSTVRVDTTLTGFERLSWQRGHQTLIFQATPRGHRVCDINHDEKTVWEKEFTISTQDPVQVMMSQEMNVLHRMSSPIVSSYLNTDAIMFERQRSGIWGFRTDKVEEVNGFRTKVFSSTGLDIVTRSRVEHLPETDKQKHTSINPLQDFLGAAQDHASLNKPAIEAPPTSKSENVVVEPCMTMKEYFTKPKNEEEYDKMGRRTPEVNSRTQSLKATVGLAETFPISLQEQVMPIIDLMALNAPHFAKVKDFIDMQMPSGFPVKLEIPLFHVISAKVIFGNVNGHTSPSSHISLSTRKKRAGPVPILTSSSSSFSPTTTEVGGVKKRHGQARGMGMSWEEESGGGDPPIEASGEEYVLDRKGKSVEVEVCTISDECFEVPPGYRKLVRGGRGMADQEEELLQMAIQQSLLEQERGGTNEEVEEVEQLSLQEALQDVSVVKGSASSPSSRRGSKQRGRGSLPLALIPEPPPPSAIPQGRHMSAGGDPDLALVLELSRQMALEEEQKRRTAEDEEFERVLQMSLQDK